MTDETHSQPAPVRPKHWMAGYWPDPDAHPQYRGLLPKLWGSIHPDDPQNEEDPAG